jgi:hypothetical protein
MAYDSTKLNLVLQGGIGNSGVAIWQLSGTDNTGTGAGTVRYTGYISDGGSRGMKVGDMLLYHDTDTYTLSTFYVKTVSSTFPGAVDLADATVIGSATNTD